MKALIKILCLSVLWFSCESLTGDNDELVGPTVFIESTSPPAFIDLNGESTGFVTPHTFDGLSLAPQTFRIYYNSDYSETETTLYLTNTNQSETIVPDIHFLWDCEEGPFSVSNDSGIVYVCDEIMTVPQTVEGAYIEIDWSPGNADACSSTGMRFKFGGTTYYLTECGDPCRLEVGDELTSDQSGSAYFVQSCGGGMNYQYYVSSIIFGVE